MAANLRFENITRRFGTHAAVRDLNLEIERGSRFALLGPSGCGKTTLLRMAAGFEVPCEGRILLDGEDITRLPPERRPLNTVFQHYALFPHLTVRQNIAFGPSLEKRGRNEILREVDRMLELVDMAAHADKRPSQLSGGQRQRVGIARALAKRPAVLLLDEPLAALDLKLRQKMLEELARIHREVGTTLVYVTHDQGEAMSISDKIAVMNQGRIQQVGTPQEIYQRPANDFVAGFIGDTNFLEGQPAGPCCLQVDDIGLIHVAPFHLPEGAGPLRVSLRPEHIRLASAREDLADFENRARCLVEDQRYQGTHTRVRLRCGRWVLFARQPAGMSTDRPPAQPADEAWIGWHARDCAVMAPASS